MSESLIAAEAVILADDAGVIAAEPVEESTAHPKRDEMLALIRGLADSLDSHARAALAEVRDEISKIIG